MRARELSKHFSDNILKTVDEMLKRVDDYLRSEEAFRNTELPKGEFQQKEVPLGNRVQRKMKTTNGCLMVYHRRQTMHNLLIGRQEYHAPYAALRNAPTMSFRRRGNQTVLTLDSLVSTQEILATEHQLHLPQPAPLVGIPKIARDSVRIWQVELSGEGCKAKGKRGTTEQRFAERQGEQVNIAGKGKIELDVCFGGSRLCRWAIMKFTIIPVPSSYNIILGRPSLKQLRAISSTIHGMMKFPTPWGIATLESQMPIIFECRGEGKKQAVERPEETEP
ncbi:hypothetical protein Tco_1217798 [Tanacetum coccineum]